MDIQNFIAEFKKTFVYDILSQTLSDEQLFERVVDGDAVLWFKEQTRQMWLMWEKAQAQAAPEKDAVIKKLSDQLYAQEMKASAARVLCETACELLDDYAHQDAMVILNDLEQAMKESAND